MKKFNSIQEWLATNPSKEEVAKVLNVINKGQISVLRKEMYEEEKHLRKLRKSFVYLQQVELPVPKELEKKIETSQKRVAELRKVVPVIKMKPKAKPVVEPKAEAAIEPEVPETPTEVKQEA